MAKPKSLKDLVGTKEEPAAPPSPAPQELTTVAAAPAPAPKKGRPKNIQVYFVDEDERLHKAIKDLAHSEDTKMSRLLVEGARMVLKDRGLA